jgi:hypothetical protein
MKTINRVDGERGNLISIARYATSTALSLYYVTRWRAVICKVTAEDQ